VSDICEYRSRGNGRYVWAILAGSVGLLAQTLGRLYSSAYYALRDTRTPLRFGVARVLLTTGLGYLCAIPLPAGLASIRSGAWLDFPHPLERGDEPALLKETANFSRFRT